METIRRKCKDSIGGLSKLWVFPYVKYNRSEIVTDGKKLITFPLTNIYEMNPLTFSVSDKQNNSDGGKFYDQNLTFSRQGFDFELQKLLKKDYRAIVQDNNGNYLIYGLFLGLECTKIDSVTGASKQDVNGMTFSFDGKEELGAYFIDDLNDTGFIFEGFILQEDGFYLLQENGFKLKL